MKIRKAQLKRIIKEELSKVLNEQEVPLRNPLNDPAQEKRALIKVLGDAQATSPDKAYPIKYVKKQMERDGRLPNEVDIDQYVSRHEPIKLGSEEEGWVEITVAGTPTGDTGLWMTSPKRSY